MKNLAFRPVEPRCALVAALVVVQVVLSTPAFGGAAEVTFNAGPETEFTVGFGAGPQSLALLDMNGDGLADLVSVDQINAATAVLLNQGGGEFAEPQAVPLDVFPTALAVGDLNGDTFNDVAVTDDDGGVSLFFGDAAGMIRFIEALDPGIELTGIVIADLDEDDALDIAVLEVCDEIVLQRNRGDGTFDCFDEEILDTGGLDPIAILAPDVNNDDHVDLIVLNRLGENISLLRGNGDGTFLPPVLIPVGASPRAFAVGRINDDELDDVIVVEAGFLGGDNVTVLLGDALMGLRPGETSTASVNAAAVALADFNGDGCLDFISPSLEEPTPALGVGNCTGVFAPPIATLQLGFGRAVQVGSLDADGRPDFVVVDDDGELISTAINETAIVAACPGDCDENGTVAVNELVTGVNILLERAAVSACAVTDTNDDGRVTVDELVRAVNNLLDGCEGSAER